MENLNKKQLLNLKRIFYLSKIDLKKLYNGSVLGWIWLIFRPCFSIFVYYFALTIGLKSEKTIFDMPYFFWLISGMVPWFFINDIFHQGCDCIKKYNYLVTKIKFPVYEVPIFSTLSRFLVHSFLMAIILLIFFIAGYGFNIYLLQLPLYMFLMLIFFTFLNILLSSLCAISRDFSNLVKSTSFAIFWFSGILWEVTSLKIIWLKDFICCFNPITFLINGYRNCFIKHIWFWEEPLSLLSFTTITITIIILSILIYKRVAKDIPDLL